MSSASALFAPTSVRGLRGSPDRVVARRRAGARSSVAVTAAADAVKFYKYQGLGNDFVLVDNRDSSEIKLSSERCAQLCDRNFGIGADGVIFAMPPGFVQADEDYSMRMYNSDGTEPEMCGNGIRCLANFVAKMDGAEPKAYKVGTLAGLIQPEVRADGQVSVDMGEPVLDPPKVPCTFDATQDGAAVRAKMEVDGETWLVTAVSMGNPHCVTFGKEGQCDEGGIKLDDFALSHYGPMFEKHSNLPGQDQHRVHRGGEQELRQDARVGARRGCHPRLRHRRVRHRRRGGAGGEDGTEVHGGAAGRAARNRVARKRQQGHHDRTRRARLRRYVHHRLRES